MERFEETEKIMENIRTIPDSDLQRRILEAQERSPGADMSDHYLMYELRRRQSLIGIRAVVEACYDANDDTPQAPEHPEDDRWITRGNN